MCFYNTLKYLAKEKEIKKKINVQTYQSLLRFGY